MKFKRWIIIFIIAMLTSSIVLGVFNYVIDPFGVFGDKVLKWHSYNMVNNPRVAKIGYLDQYHKQYDSYIIGGSKSSSLSPELLNQYYGDARFYSMLMYGGDFYDYEKTLYYLVDHYEVENIIIHLSMFEISGYKVSSDDVKQNLHAKVSGESLTKFYLKHMLLNPKYSFDKLEGYAKRAVDSFQFSQIKPENGVYNKIKRDAEKVDDLEAYLTNNPSFVEPLDKRYAGAADQNAASLQRMKEYCEKRNIDFKVVTGVTYDAEVERYQAEDLKSYWRKLADVTDLWDFSGYNSISHDPRYFYDTTHYRNSAGNMMLAYMFKDEEVYVPKGFGHYTTQENVNAHVKRVFNKPPHRPSVSNTFKDERSVPILSYHHIDLDASKQNRSIVTPDKFENDMVALKQAGYETIFLSELVDYVYSGKDLPDKPVLVTFDDGYLSNYQYAYPILRNLNMKATISVIGWSVGETKYKGSDRDIIPHFTWEQAREMFQSGHIDIQNHSYDMHETGDTEYSDRRGILQKADERSGPYSAAFMQDVLKLEELIETNVGNEVYNFTYPHGEYSHLSEQILYDLGYDVTLSTKDGISEIVKGNPQSLFALKRINAGAEIPSGELIERLNKAFY